MPTRWPRWCATPLAEDGGRGLVLELPFGRIAALRSGTPGGEPVLALHGWLDNAASFLPLAAHLPAHLDLVAVDLPGHGRSDWLPPGHPYLLPLAVPQVLAIADALGWDRFALLGHSMGGAIASLVAAAAPERITAVASIEAIGPLAATPGESLDRLRRFVRAAATPQRPRRVFADRQAMVALRMARNGLDEAGARLLVERGSVAVDGGWQWSSDPALTRPSPVYLAEAQVRELLAGIACPVRVIVAGEGLLPPSLCGGRLACLARGSVQRLPGGHHLHLGDPAGVAAALAAEWPTPSPD